MNSVVFRQHHRRIASIPFCNNVELCFVDHVAGKYAAIGFNGKIVQRLICFAQIAIVAAGMPFDEFSEIDTMLLRIVEAVSCNNDLA